MNGLIIPTDEDIGNRRLRMAFVALCVLAVAGAHWWTPRANITDHAIHVLLRKMFLIPIVLAAVWLTLKGALLTALAITALYLPHVALQWSGETTENINQVGEVLTFWAIAAIAGVMVQREKQAISERAKTYQGAVRALVAALDAREHDTEQHSERVCAYSLRLARQLTVSGQVKHALALGSLLHDIGKIGIPDRILLKPGPLTDEEWQCMRTHPDMGAKILASVPFLADAIQIVNCHHERFDGSGYPRGLSGAEIPLGARIFAVADVYDALTSARPYRQPMSPSQAGDEIKRASGSHFDPLAVDAFLSIPTDEWSQLRHNIIGM